jgi:hypothetical protein
MKLQEASMTKRTKRLAAWTTGLLLAMTLGAVAAEDAPDIEAPAEVPAADVPSSVADPEAGPPDDAPPDAAPPDAAQAPTAEDAGGGVFVPTEEISEDFAVSFPVDI